MRKPTQPEPVKISDSLGENVETPVSPEPELSATPEPGVPGNDAGTYGDSLTSRSLENAVDKLLLLTPSLKETSTGTREGTPVDENEGNKELSLPVSEQFVSKESSGSGTNDAASVSSTVKGDDESLVYYGKGPRNYALGSVWFAAVFNVFLFAGLGTIWLIKTAFISSKIPLDFPMELLGIGWFLPVALLALVSICCSVYAYFVPLPEDEGKPFYRNYATLGLVVVLVGVSLGVLVISMLR